jgi:hypothetical protein
MREWQKAGLVVLALLALVVAIYATQDTRREATGSVSLPAEGDFVGREQCAGCHADAYEQWLGSDHDNAMDVATDDTVLGDFDNAEFMTRCWATSTMPNSSTPASRPASTAKTEHSS